MTRRRVAICGTIGGGAAHRRRGEPICDACRTAESEYAHLHRRGRAHTQNGPTGPDLPMFDDSAVCMQVGSDPFFVEKGGNVKPAKAACRQCPWIEPCLEYALAWDVKGTWGGTSGKERDDIRAERHLIPFSIITGRLTIHSEDYIAPIPPVEPASQVVVLPVVCTGTDGRTWPAHVYAWDADRVWVCLECKEPRP